MSSIFRLTTTNLRSPDRSDAMPVRDRRLWIVDREIDDIGRNEDRI